MNLEKWITLIMNLIQILCWPVVVIILFLSLRKPIIQFISHINEAEFPGGIKLKSINREIEKAESITTEIKSEVEKANTHLPEEVKKDPNELMESVGLEKSPSNLDIKYYYDLVENNPSIALAGLRMDLEIMIRNLSKGFRIRTDNNSTIGQLLEVLINNSAITTNQYRLIKIILNICNAAVHGQSITKAQAINVLDMTPILINDYISWLNWGFK